jgi:C-terminal processing protease CtpA/Prc
MFELIYPKLFIHTNKYKIKYQPYGSEEIVEIEMDAFDTKTIWMPKMMTQNPFQVEYREDLNAAIIKLKTFFFGGNNDAYYAFLENTFAKIKEEKIQNIILDLRANGGGDPMAAARLFSFITPKPVKYFKDNYSEGYEKLTRPVELPENHFNGNIYTIIDGGGASTTGHIVSLIKYHKIGVIVGSELGSTYTCNDACVYTSLRHTRLTAKIARSTFTTAVENMKADQGVLPDYPIGFSVDNLVNGIDTEMKFIFEMINKE